METTEIATDRALLAGDRSALSKSHRRTMDALFAHPVAHNLDWQDVVSLLNRLGTLEHLPNNDMSLRMGDDHQNIHKPHGKDLTIDDIMVLRHFLTRVGWSLKHPRAAAEQADKPDFLITIEHHEAKIYHMDLASDDPADHVIRPYDPHHFLHHLTHKDETRQRGERAAEDPGYYENICQAVASAVPHGRIVVIGHGKGHSDAAHHLIEWMKLHHRETFQHVVCELSEDLSAVTQPQLLVIARDALKHT
jgi:hypothetical protein